MTYVSQHVPLKIKDSDVQTARALKVGSGAIGGMIVETTAMNMIVVRYFR